MVEAARDASPGTPIGVPTGLWTVSDPADRLAAIRGWRVLPDYASVNWHEPGSVELAGELLDRGVGVEAGLWTPADVAEWRQWPRRSRCLRILLEVVEARAVPEALSAARALVAAVGSESGLPVLLHGQDQTAWPILEAALRWGLDVRIGLEDTLSLPDGHPAADNGELVAAARDPRSRISS